MTLTYAAASAASADALRLATPATQRPGVFFDGFVEHPVPAARALLLVAAVAARRFHEPGALVAARIRNADPVVTAEPGRLRFESFSVCAGVHARLDLTEDGLDVRACAPGTTNVDFNDPVRAALAGVRTTEPLRVTVGRDELTLQTLDATAVEQRVPLPERWVKGFGEVQAALAGAELLVELDRIRAQRFLAALPGGDAVAWAEPTRTGVRLGQTRRPGSVCVAGPTRLRALLPLMRFAGGLRAYGNPDADGPTTVAWVLALPGGRITLTLSPEPDRGFSGEGGLLLDLVDRRARDDAATVGHALAGRTRFGLDDAAQAAGLPRERTTRALTWLALYGHLGADPADRAYFWRHLPYPEDVLAAEPARLRDARALADAKQADRGAGSTWTVRSGDAEYRATLDATGRFSCTCPWGARHGTSRGPCKHVLAAALEAAA